MKSKDSRIVQCRCYHSQLHRSGRKEPKQWGNLADKPLPTGMRSYPLGNLKHKYERSHLHTKVDFSDIRLRSFELKGHRIEGTGIFKRRIELFCKRRICQGIQRRINYFVCS